MLIRRPAVAGTFYENNPSALKEQIAEYVNLKTETVEVKGALIPHAGYIYSGKVAGAVYSKIKFPELFIILCPNHTGLGEKCSIMAEGIWQTPFGEVHIAQSIANEILNESAYLSDNVQAHLHEHAIEVQLPFIQYFKKPFNIIPICLAIDDIKALSDIGQAIATAVKHSNKKTVIISSSDMTHYEPQEIAKEKDKTAIDAILALDEKLLLAKIDELKISMCGYIPTAVMIIACKLLGATSAELVKYATSGDISSDYGSVVGYAGITIN
ncbi:MAG: AmmeMemoRadiSam system protein B [Candidatus Firestonebacteria bacterium]